MQNLNIMIPHTKHTEKWNLLTHKTKENEGAAY